MKKFTLLFAGMLMFSIAVVHAQDAKDTTKVAPQDQSINQPTDQYIQKEYMQVQASEIPASLRTTLKGTEYTGWENGMLYRNKTSKGYLIRISEGTMTSNYYFDKSGKRVQDPLKP